MQNTKTLLMSKTFWLAMLQGFIAIVVIFQGVYPQVGALLVMKSVLDVFLRLYTTQPIGTPVVPPIV